jgi:hypothetical protein
MDGRFSSHLGWWRTGPWCDDIFITVLFHPTLIDNFPVRAPVGCTTPWRLHHPICPPTSLYTCTSCSTCSRRVPIPNLCVVEQGDRSVAPFLRLVKWETPFLIMPTVVRRQKGIRGGFNRRKLLWSNFQAIPTVDTVSSSCFVSYYYTSKQPSNWTKTIIIRV